ncbi:MAG: galactosyltransferase-related protein, partial [Nitrospira sp.]|nr:galactosyltransferase-related protein [Nitrospira sp.]
DDGSTEETAAVIRSFQRRGTVPLLHVWHEDQGFRAAAIRNRAVAAADADYIVFTDGDCVPSRRFVEAHKTLAEVGYFLSSHRMLLSERLTDRVLRNSLPLHQWRWIDWAGQWMKRDVNRLLPLLRLPDGLFRKWAPNRWEGVKTCNLSVWRHDLVCVNGLDESYEGWGLEDSDLVIRLLRTGVKHKSARLAAPVFHLWHPEQDRSAMAENQVRLEALLRSDRVRAVKGLDRYQMA